MSRDVKFIGNKIPKYVFLGIFSTILMYVAVAGIISTTSPWFLGRGDAPRHIDYVYRVYNGDLPKFKDGFRQPEIKELSKGIYRDQGAASNPPLFYLIHAPFVGPSLSNGHWQKGVMIGHTLNIFLGVLCLLALSWGGWILGGERKHTFAVAVPAIAGSFYTFTSLNLNYAVDVLLILFTTLTLIVCIKILQNGLNNRYAVSLCILGAMGMATKVSYIVFIGVSIFAVFLRLYIDNPFKNKNLTIKLVKKSLITCMAILASVAVSIGWFYYLRNYKSTGNFMSAMPGDYGSLRKPKSLQDVMLGSGLWSLLYGKYSSSANISNILSIFSLAGLFVIMEKFSPRRLLADKKATSTALLLTASFIGVFLTQIEWAVGTGGFYHRYLLPATLPISLVLSAGLLAFKVSRNQFVTIASVILGVTTIIHRGKGGIMGLNEAAIANHIYPIVPSILVVIFFAGGVLLSIALFQLAKRTPQGTAG